MDLPGPKSTTGGPDAGSPPGDAASEVDGGPEPLQPFEGEGDPWKGPVPRATCGADDLAEDVLQGAPGQSQCNLDIVSQLEVPIFLGLAWYRDCAYVNGNDGTTVIRVSDDGQPSITATLTQTGFRAAWESMKANPSSGLLVGYEANGSMLGIADLSQDCSQPQFAANLQLPGALLGASIGHAGEFNPDGTIYYASSMYTFEIFAVDLTEPTMPEIITTDFSGVGAHDLNLGKGGTRAYLAASADPGLPYNAGAVGSFSIMDTTQIEQRVPDAKATLIHEEVWEDGNATQYPIPVSYRGEDYLIINDELGSGGCGDPENPIWGYVRIFDIREETKPVLTSLVKTEAQDPEYCESEAQAGPGAIGFGAGAHYCSVDRRDDPRLLACGNFVAGLRIYDIRNPWRPREVAYFSREGEELPGLPRIYVEKREIWIATQPGTFYVLKIRAGSPIDQVLAETP